MDIRRPARLLFIARGSLHEAEHWLLRAGHAAHRCDATSTLQVEEVARTLNGLINRTDAGSRSQRLSRFLPSAICHLPPHTGITPCRFQGRSTRFVAAISSALIDRGARLARVDHVVDHRVARGDVRVDDLLEVRDQLGPLGVRVVGRLDLLAHDDVHGALGAHHRDLRARPGHDQVGLVGLAAHHVVARAVGLPDDDRDLRDGRARDGVEHLRAVADDAGLLDLRADHEAGHVLEEEQRDTERVAQVDEARRLVGGVVLEDPAELLRLARDDADRTPAHPREAGDDRLRELRLNVEVEAVVDDPADHLVHVVGLAVRVRHDRRAAPRPCARPDRSARGAAAPPRSSTGRTRGSP